MFSSLKKMNNVPAILLLILVLVILWANWPQPRENLPRRFLRYPFEDVTVPFANALNYKDPLPHRFEFGFF